jgi:hypothetical protein
MPAEPAAARLFSIPFLKANARGFPRSTHIRDIDIYPVASQDMLLLSLPFLE